MEIGVNGTVLVRVGRVSCVVPIDCAIALQTVEARDYLADPTIAQFLFAARDMRQRAAWDISRPGVADKRRDFKRELMAAGISEGDATWLAVLKHP